MALTTCSVATNNIASLDNLPNDVGGLTATQLKEKFDKFGADFVAWFNATHMSELDANTLVIMTTQGDIVYRGASAPARLAKGTALQTLQMNSGATAPEWAASPQSVLTGQGDLLYASAANVLARLAKGTASQLLRMNAGATAPEWATIATGVSVKMGSFTRDTSVASGTQDITGVGFQPKAVIFFSIVDSTAEMSVGLDDGTVGGCIISNHTVAANTWTYSNSASIYLLQGAGIAYTGNITAFGADGFTITWTKGGAKTGTAVIKYLAIG